MDLERLKATLRKVIQNNSVLRTSFHFVPDLGRWIQAVHSVDDLDWSESELDCASPLSEQVREWICTLALSTEASFAKPPIYMRLYRKPESVSGESRTLVLLLHHALYDGISIARLSDVLNSYYHDEEPSVAAQFVDLIKYFLYQERYGSQYWLNMLSSFKRPHLPKNETIQLSSNESSVQSEVTIPITSKQTEMACMEFGATAQCFGQAALAKVLGRLYEKSDIVFGRVVSGRNTVQAENVIGPLIVSFTYP